MNSCRGNISMVLLLLALFLAAVAQLAMVYVYRNMELELEHLRQRQLRLLCGSVINELAEQELEAGEVFWEGSLQPGNVPVGIKGKVDFSSDGMFRALSIRTEADALNHSLRHIRFSLNEEQTELAKQAMFICGKELVNSEFLTEGVIYTSAEEVGFPQIGFLKNTGEAKRSISALDMEDLRLYGLDRRIYYLSNGATPLTFSKNLKVYGTAVIATEGSIIIEANCQFFERVILLSKGNIIIKDGVELPQAFLQAYGKVTIGTGCKLGGIVFSGSNVELLGACQFTHDENVVAPFSSAFFIL